MGVIEQVKSGRRHRLTGRSLVGRSSTCVVKIEHTAVSREHAVIYWSEGLWGVKDLSSRNGTSVNGKRLKSGDSTLVRLGDTMEFGDGGVTFRLIDAQPPDAFALAPDGSEVVAVNDLLFLPDDGDPQATIFMGQEGWVCETDAGTAPFDGRQTLALGDTEWRVFLPADNQGRVTEDAAGPALLTMQMQFRVSRDEEYVEVSLRRGRRLIELQSRAFTYMLLTLARIRLKDALDGDLKSSEHGWVHQTDLGSMLATDRQTLNVHVCRARRQLSKNGVVGAADVIERRPGTGQLRIGLADLQVTGL